MVYEHNHVVTLIWQVNNNPKYFGENRRPFVEFALEDSRIVDNRRKKISAQISRNQKRQEQEQHTDNSSSKNKKSNSNRKKDSTAGDNAPGISFRQLRHRIGTFFVIYCDP